MAEFRVAFFPADFDASRRFYEDVLRFRVMGEWTRPGDRGVIFEAGGGVVELLAYAERQPSPAGVSISIEVEDADAAHAAVRSRSSVLDAAPPADQVWGHRSFTVTDPDGISVTFFEVLST